MSYTPTTWVTGDVITATKLNNIETGISTLETEVSNIKVVEEYTATGSDTIAANDLIYIAGTLLAAKCGTFKSSTSLAAAATWLSAAVVDTNKVVVVYCITGSGQYAICVDFSTSFISPTVGSAVLFEAGNPDNGTSIVAYDTGKFAIAYRDAGDSSKGKVVGGSVSGQAITMDTANIQTFDATAGGNYAHGICKMDTNKCLIAYSYGTTEKAVVASFTGTVPSLGTAETFASVDCPYMVVTQLTTDKAVVAYNDSSDAGKGKHLVVSVSSTTPSFGAITTFETGATSQLSIATLSSAAVVLAYRDGGNSNYGTGVISTIASTDVTAGTAVVFESAATSYTSCVALSSDKGMVLYEDTANSNYGTYASFSFTGTNTITFGTPSVFESLNATTYICNALISSNRMLVAYNESAGSAARFRTLNLEPDGVAQSAELLGSRKLAVSLF